MRGDGQTVDSIVSQSRVGASVLQLLDAHIAAPTAEARSHTELRGAALRTSALLLVSRSIVHACATCDSETLETLRACEKLHAAVALLSTQALGCATALTRKGVVAGAHSLVDTLEANGVLDSQALLKLVNETVHSRACSIVGGHPSEDVSSIELYDRSALKLRSRDHAHWWSDA